MRQTVQPVPKGKEFFKHKKNYKGIPHKQSDSAFSAFDKFFNEQKFDIVIELGSGAGGFSLYLAEKFGKKFYTFDMINKLDKYSDVKNRLLKLGAHFYFENVFKSNTLNSIFNMDGRVLLLCDNGDKLEELITFSPKLKSGDVIMAHDYFPTAEDYYNQTIWKTCALTDGDENDDTLDPYYKDDFVKAFWMCRIKK